MLASFAARGRFFELAQVAAIPNHLTAPQWASAAGRHITASIVRQTPSAAVHFDRHHPPDS